MKIKKFKGRKIYGFLDYNIKFNEDLSFLYGDNGVGKTTIIKLVRSLMKMEIAELIATEFSSLEISFTHNGGLMTLKCEKSLENISFEFRTPTKVLNDEIHTSDYSRMFNKRMKDEYYDRLTYEVFKQIRKMEIYDELKKLDYISFIGLNRVYDRGRSKKKYLDESSSSSNIGTISKLIMDEFKEAKVEKEKKLEHFRVDIVRSLFSETEKADLSLSKLKNLYRNRESVIKSASILQDDILTEHIKKHYKLISRLLDKIEKLKIGEDYLKDTNLLIEAINLQSTVNRITSLSSIALKYAKETEEIMSRFTSFVDTVNSYFIKSRKRIEIDPYGIVDVYCANNQPGKVGILSSGEKQFFMIIATVIFDSNSKVLIIDEPELSLHIEWQNKFVDLIRNLRPNIQMIMATHSPDLVNKHVRKIVKVDNAKK